MGRLGIALHLSLLGGAHLEWLHSNPWHPRIGLPFCHIVSPAPGKLGEVYSYRMEVKKGVERGRETGRGDREGRNERGKA